MGGTVVDQAKARILAALVVLIIMDASFGATACADACRARALKIVTRVRVEIEELGPKQELPPKNIEFWPFPLRASDK